jgi:hypothetical protein
MTDLSAANRAWFESLKEQSLLFFKGDNNAPWAIFAEVVMGCVPILGQVIDARDIVKGLVEVTDDPDSEDAWFNLITALAGLVPLGGDATKQALRAIKRGTANVDDLTAMIRRFYKGDPEKLLREVLDLSVLRNKLNEILDHPNLKRHLSTQNQMQMSRIRIGLSEHFDTFQKQVDDWLTRGRKTSAESPVRPITNRGTPEAKPGSIGREGSRSNMDASNDVFVNRANSATLRTARFKQVTAKLLGVMGEHMADYYCQDVKGWGEGKAFHDNSEINLAKLNDGHRLVQLWPCIPRGRGIDAVWKSDGVKPYAIIEAKASVNPARTLGQLLGEAGDKNESGSKNTGEVRRRTGNGSSTGSGSGHARQKNGKVTQMSHQWIQGKRLALSVGDTLASDIRRHGYSRHVLLFSIPHAVAHSEALILHGAGNSPHSSTHARHEKTREWLDNEIERVVNNRAGINSASRSKKGI